MTNGLHTNPSAETYTIASLVEHAWRGSVRVPHFQRIFRWGRNDIIRLFDSIVKGYPIGSLLLWVQPAREEVIDLGGLVVEAPKLDSALWVVDGQQRVSSLASALTDDRRRDDRFDLAYDLRERVFVKLPHLENPFQIPLPVLFDLRRLIAWFAARPEASEYLDDASKVTAAIRQFEVPAYLVEQNDEAVLVDIFDRMNNYGKRLSRAEVFSALFADHQGGDSRLTIPTIAEHVAERSSFGRIDDDTVLRAILARRGPDPTRDPRPEFGTSAQLPRGAVNFPDEDQATAFRLGEDALSRAVDFLQSEAGVPHFSLVAYRYLLIALARLFGHHPQLSPQNLRLMRRWYWRAAIGGPEIFKGSPSYAMRALCSRVLAGRQNESIQGLLDAVSSTPPKVPNLRRFRPSESLSKVLICSWWSREPLSPYTGEPYNHQELASVIGDNFTATPALPHIVSRRAVPEKAPNWAANRLIILDKEKGGNRSLDDILALQPLNVEPQYWKNILRTHQIDDEAVSMLLSGRLEDFLEHRQRMLRQAFEDFVALRCEWNLEDTPPIDELVWDDESEGEELTVIDGGQ